ncbi:hypothetical protein [Cohnella sp. JJ-181]|uniref:hypothetical protein n=1 Tax=Cohnella rhizoplanae TaxID=2974897 RepID=UPI0022FFBBF6|nr:hypothetical protein [Cohnella sp. JJ-181]CAI6082915.1 hypothetical protein COHCIP112018_03806 [Cohnella sp. JJ-181]
MRKRGWTGRFRQAIDLTAAGKTPILGPARCTAEEMRGYIARRNPDAPDLAERYLAAGERYGVRGDLAFCHAVHETNAWRGRPGGDVGWAGGGAGQVWQVPGLGALWQQGAEWQGTGVAAEWPQGADMTGAGGQQHRASSVELAVEAHMQRLLRYASPERFVQETAAVRNSREDGQPRPAIYRRWSYWEDLDGVIHPARRDGSGTVAIWRRMLEWAGKGGESRVSSVNGWSGVDKLAGRELEGWNEQDAQRRAAGAAFAQGGEAELQWLLARGLLQAPAPAPGRAVTWAELAGLLRRLEENAGRQPEPAAPGEAEAAGD